MIPCSTHIIIGLKVKCKFNQWSKNNFSKTYEVPIPKGESSASENEDALLVDPLRLLGLGLLLLRPPDGHGLVVGARVVRWLLPLPLLAHFEKKLQRISIKTPNPSKKSRKNNFEGAKVKSTHVKMFVLTGPPRSKFKIVERFASQMERVVNI